MHALSGLQMHTLEHEHCLGTNHGARIIIKCL